MESARLLLELDLAQAYGQLGRKKEARAAVAKLLELYPDYPIKARQEFRVWNTTDQFVEHQLDGLRKAGLDIPPE